MEAGEAERRGLQPLGVYRGMAVAGCDAGGNGHRTGLRRAEAARSGTASRSSDIGLWELNEAFAVQVLYCRDRLGGRVTRRRLFRPLARADRRRSTTPSRSSGCRPRGRRRLHAQRRPAAARADRPRPGRRAGPLLPRRADRRRRPAQPARARGRAGHPRRSAAPPSCWSPTSSARSQPLVDRAVVHARRSGRLRRPAAARRGDGARAPPPRRTPATTTCRTSAPPSTSLEGGAMRTSSTCLSLRLHAARAARRPADRARRARRSAPSSCSAGWPCWATASATSPSPASRSACSPAPPRPGPRWSSRSSARC